MRFPLRRHHTPEAVMERISRIEGQFQPETAPGAPAAGPFEPGGLPYAWGAPRSEDAPPPPLFLTPEPEPEPPAPALHAVDNRMRDQLTSTDSRADRLVRQVRNEVEQLKKTLETLSYDHDAMLELDVAALLADPEQAAALPPAVLVRAVVETAEENERLRNETNRQRTKATRLRRQLRDLQREDAARQARLDTLEEVIAALHANLEDLRFDRGRLHLAGPQAQALRAAAAQLPVASSEISSCD